MGETSVHSRVAALLPELYALRPLDQFPAHALGLVRRAVGGNKGDYTEVDLRSGNFRVLVDPEPPELAALAPARRAHMHTHPVLAHFRHSAVAARPDDLGLPQPARVPPPRPLRRLLRELGVEDQLTVLVSPASRRFAQGSRSTATGPGSTYRDRLLMDALQPHLQAARENAIRFSRALAGPAATDAVRRAGVVGTLTDRQHEVLRQISDGLTDAQIAFRLQISVGTVRKHVEHILRRLTATRTAAAVVYLTSTEPMPNPNLTASIPFTSQVTA